MSVFEQGHQFLRERELDLLDLLERIEQELAHGRNSHVTKSSEDAVRLGTLVSELEKMAQQPAVELLQDLSDVISKYPWKKLWIEKCCQCCNQKAGKLRRDLEYKTTRIVLNSQPANGCLSVSPSEKSLIFTGLWMNKYQHGWRFDPEPGVLLKNQASLKATAMMPDKEPEAERDPGAA
ncbi:tripartite motif-containing protein 26-like [Felis catus]|uniref:tripartite motif-containing protein 26-like n=1 Tax=Felis catus TaxID=9685 RepID=UPI0009485E91|nr:tripartite motif-containing protein 26-like [Felis catus]